MIWERNHHGGESLATLDQARAAKDEAAARVGRLGIVVGVGIAKVGDEYGVKVNLREAPPEGSEIPSFVGTVPILVEVVGPVKKRSIS